MSALALQFEGKETGARDLRENNLRREDRPPIVYACPDVSLLFIS